MLRIDDLGTLAYRPAWDLQERAHAEVAAGGRERLLLVEHPPVITFGRRPGIERNLIASEEQLASLGVEVVASDRGGDITFHGPGQLVVYPIIRLADHRLSVSGYVHSLEAAVISALRRWGIEAHADPAAVGVWVNINDRPTKVCAIGVRIRKGVSMHGLALNVTTDLNYFNLIVPCGLSERGVTSLEQLLPPGSVPDLAHVKEVICRCLSEQIESRNGSG
jgi:lipoyl(octanoyl) transferase